MKRDKEKFMLIFLKKIILLTKEIYEKTEGNIFMSMALIKKIEKEIYQLNPVEKMLLIKDLVNSLGTIPVKKATTGYSKYFGMYRKCNLDVTKEVRNIRNEWNRNIC